MANKFRVGFITSIVLLIIFTGILVYVWNTKTQEIKNLSSQLTSLNSKIEQKNQEIKKLDESLKLVKFVCIFNLDCKEEYSEKLGNEFLKVHNLQNAKHKYEASGQNYYKYFLERGDTIDLPSKLRVFIESNCPKEMYTIPGKTDFIRRAYYLDEREEYASELSIVMDEETLDILCSWVYNPSTDSYSQP